LAKITGSRIRTISLFAGCGGFDLGLLGGFKYLNEYYAPLGFEIVGAYDIDPKSIDTYKLNISDRAEICNLVEKDLESLPTADLLLGGFPCQDFSSSGLKQGLEGKRGRLYRILIDYMNIHRPSVVVGENVPHLGRMHDGKILHTIVSELEEVGYKFKVWDINCPDFGLPQSRRRLFMVGVRNDLVGHPIPPMMTHFMGYRPIEDAIDDLKTIIDEMVPNQSQYFVATVATAGAGQGDQISRRGEVAYTVRANAKARIHFHYELERRLTVRECARLQSFPDEFVFPHFAMNNMSQIGNAVPPIIGNHVGRAIMDFFDTLKA
jgi:DNA (cytosine-5)-methyltransferase 1